MATPSDASRASSAEPAAPGTTSTGVAGREASTERSDAINDALKRLAEILGSSGGAPTAPISTGPGGGIIPLPGPAQPSPAGSALTPEQRAEIARIWLYCTTVPIITADRRRELETALPLIIAWLKTLPYRPSVKAAIAPLIDAAKQQASGPNRSADSTSRVTALTDMLMKDLQLQAGGERVIPLLALCVAGFMGGYMVAHTWGH